VQASQGQVWHATDVRYRIRYSRGMGEAEWEIFQTVFDPWRSAILLVAGDKTGQWHTWHEHAIPQAEQSYEVYLQERAKAGEEARNELL
jgi:hypothetical protein